MPAFCSGASKDSNWVLLWDERNMNRGYCNARGTHCLISSML